MYVHTRTHTHIYIYIYIETVPRPNAKIQMAEQEVACVSVCPGNYANTLLNESGSETVSIFEHP